MVKISHTNVIVDEFSTARNNPFNKYIHFLTHIHADHLKGLSNSWDYGPIYCSSITKSLILLKYPRLKCLKQLQLEKPYTIALSSQLQITVTMFDANHCAGGVMLLLEGYMGTVLYTGDMRFDKEVFSQYTYLYPHVRRNKQFKHCSIDIDFLYLDTTFLHPKFSFPPKYQALTQLDKYIQQTITKAKEQNKFIEFYIGIDSFGKEEVLVHLAQKFQTLITVSQQRYKNISLIGLDSQYFTTDPTAGFIHIVMKRELKQCVVDRENCLGIILTGWANKAHSRSAKTYAIPYSLHSSYPQLVQFVDSIRPCYIESILEAQLRGNTGDKRDSNRESNNRESSGSNNRESSLFNNRQSNRESNNRQSNGFNNRESYGFNNRESNGSQGYSTTTNRAQKAGELKLAQKFNSYSKYSNPNNLTNPQYELYEQIDTSQYLNKLRNQYTTRASSELVFLMSNVQFQKKIKEKLKLDRVSVEMNRQQQLSVNNTSIIRVENINRAGAKLNNERNQQEIERIKQKVKSKKESARNAVMGQYTNRISVTNRRVRDENQRHKDNKGNRQHGILDLQDDQEEGNYQNRQQIENNINKSYDNSDQLQILSKSFTSQKQNQSNSKSISKSNSNSKSISKSNSSGKQSICSNNQQINNLNNLNNNNNLNNLNDNNNNQNLKQREYQNEVSKFNDSKQSIQKNDYRQSPQRDGSRQRIQKDVSRQHKQEEDEQTNRRNKWRQKVQQGQIDLFGKISLSKKPIQKNNNIRIHINTNNKYDLLKDKYNIGIDPKDKYNIGIKNNRNNSNANNNQTVDISANDQISKSNTISISRSNNNNNNNKNNNKKYIQHNNIIQLISDQDNDQNDNLNIDTKKSSSIENNNKSSFIENNNKSLSIDTNKIYTKNIQNTNSNSNTNSRSRRTNKISIQRKNNSFITEKKNNLINISNEQIVLPKQRQPDQRSIIEFFNKKSYQPNQNNNKSTLNHQLQQENNNNHRQQQQQNEENNNNNNHRQQQQQNGLIQQKPQYQLNNSSNSQLNHNEQQSQLQFNKAIQDQNRLQLKGFKTLKHSQQISILALDSTQISMFKQAKPNQYKHFFIRNQH